MQSMEQVYQEHAQTVYRYLLSLTHDSGIAEELTQETFYQAVKSAARFDGSCKVSTWLCAIAKHSLSRYRRKHPELAQLDDQIGQGQAADRDLLEQEARVELLRKVHGLKAEAREVMYLRIFGGAVLPGDRGYPVPHGKLGQSDLLPWERKAERAVRRLPV